MEIYSKTANSPPKLGPYLHIFNPYAVTNKVVKYGRWTYWTYSQIRYVSWIAL